MKRITAYTILLICAWLAGACSTTAAVITERPPTAATPTSPARETALPAAQFSRVTATAAPTTEAGSTPLSTDAVDRLPASALTAAPALPSPRPRPTLRPGAWQKLPVIPAVSENVVAIYRRGQELGNNPNAFSKIGDCGSTPAWFLGDFDRGPRFYSLGDHTDLEAVIDVFRGSFDRTSLAARSGFNASALFVPLWADLAYCLPNESPLACEYRNHRPSLAFIMLGTNDVWRPDEFEPQLRQIIEFSIQNGVIPLLSTKADNQEGDGSINATIARLAYEYDLPLWNYWAAVQLLPNAGLQEDGAHLTWGANRFDDPLSMQKAWPVRNLTALQMLQAVWQKVRSD